LAKLILKKNEDRRIRKSHLWVFSNEIAEIKEEIQNGEFVELYDYQNKFMGRGFYNRKSLIAFRLLARDNESDLKNIFRRKIFKAFELRKKVYPNRESYRLVFSEGDFFPGLIIDKFNNTYVLQVYSAGIENNIELIIQILKEDFQAESIFTKNEEYFRKLEGLPIEDFTYVGDKKVEVINDGFIKYRIDFEKSQKTGFFFDQSDNRFFIERFCSGKKVLDAFCNSGGFGLHASYSGTSDVVFVDSSATEISNTKINFELNNFDNPAEFIVSDVFDYLQKCNFLSTKFNIVMIDPPAFAKSKKSLPAAIKGYEKLNRLALECCEENGLLISSSCSHHLKAEEFIKIVNNAASKVNKCIQLVYFNNASLDHPQNPAMEETVYLKFAVFRVIDS
jgi:23S rRNA (cytosine1962-C5)-methyltransferase